MDDTFCDFTNIFLTGLLKKTNPSQATICSYRPQYTVQVDLFLLLTYFLQGSPYRWHLGCRRSPPAPPRRRAGSWRLSCPGQRACSPPGTPPPQYHFLCASSSATGTEKHRLGINRHHWLTSSTEFIAWIHRRHHQPNTSTNISDRYHQLTIYNDIPQMCLSLNIVINNDWFLFWYAIL